MIHTINIILNKIYENKIISSKLKREQFKTLLELCTKKLHFSFNGSMYQQIDGVAMGNPLGPVLANIFMSSLEENYIPNLIRKLYWGRYVDDTFTILKSNEVDNILLVLNSYHKNIKFTYEVERENCLAVFHKATNANIYINWKAFASKFWKIGTLKGLYRKAFLVSSVDNRLNKEINLLKHVFVNINNVIPRVTYKEKKLGYFFPIKDKVDDKHKSNLVYGFCRNA